MSDDRPRTYPVALLVAVVALLVVARSLFLGLYHYGKGGQTSQLPLVIHVMDWNYLARDWTVAVRTAPDSPRFVYVHVMAAVGELVSLPAAMLLGYVMAISMTLSGMYLITDELFGDRLAATLVVGTYLSPVPVYLVDFGGNVIAYSGLYPSLITNGFAITGAYLALRGRYRLAFGLSGVGTWFHIANGFWLGLTVGACVATLEAGDSLRAGDIGQAIRDVPWDAAVIYFVTASVSIGPLLVANLADTTGFEAVRLMAWVRHPHHYVPSTWPLWRVTGTSLLAVLSTAAMYAYRERLFATRRAMVFGLSWTVTLITILLTGGFFTEVVPVGLVIKSQPFHVDGFLFLVIYGVLWKLGLDALERGAAGVRRRLPAGLGRDVDPSALVTLLFVVVLLCGIPAASLAAPAIDDIEHVGLTGELEVYGTAEYDPELTESYEWIRAETPRDATFIASPEQNGFRLETGRAMVVNEKSFPFVPASMIEWGDRVGRLCGADGELDTGDLRSCERGYNSLSAATIRAVAAEHEACWILSKNRSYPFERVFSNEEYVIYHLRGSSHC